MSHYLIGGVVAGWVIGAALFLDPRYMLATIFFLSVVAIVFDVYQRSRRG